MNISKIIRKDPENFKNIFYIYDKISNETYETNKKHKIHDIQHCLYISLDNYFRPGDSNYHRVEAVRGVLFLLKCGEWYIQYRLQCYEPCTHLHNILSAWYKDLCNLRILDRTDEILTYVESNVDLTDLMNEIKILNNKMDLLQKKNEVEVYKDIICLICHASVKNIDDMQALVPCGHLYCHDCISFVKDKCTLCSNVITATLKIYN